MTSMKYGVRVLVASNLSFFHELHLTAGAGNERGINLNKPVMNHWFGAAEVELRKQEQTNWVVTDHWLDGSDVSRVLDDTRPINLQGQGKNWRLVGEMVRGKHYGTLRVNDIILFAFNASNERSAWVCLRGNGSEPAILGTRTVSAKERDAHEYVTTLLAQSGAVPAGKSMWNLSAELGREAWARAAAVYPSAAVALCAIEDDLHDQVVEAQIDNGGDAENLDSTTRTEIRLARRGQGRWRQRLIDRWQSCVISGLVDSRLLRASHVKPWSESTNTERIDVENGLLLAPHFDLAFDRGLISFADDGKIIFSSEFAPSDRAKIGLTDDAAIPLPSSELREFLKYHRKRKFIK